MAGFKASLSREVPINDHRELVYEVKGVIAREGIGNGGRLHCGRWNTVVAVSIAAGRSLGCTAAAAVGNVRVRGVVGRLVLTLDGHIRRPVMLVALSTADVGLRF